MARRRTREAPEEFAEDWALLRSLKAGKKSYVGRRGVNDKATVKVTDGKNKGWTFAASICHETSQGQWIVNHFDTVAEAETQWELIENDFEQLYGNNEQDESKK